MLDPFGHKSPVEMNIEFKQATDDAYGRFAQQAYDQLLRGEGIGKLLQAKIEKGLTKSKKSYDFIQDPSGPCSADQIKARIKDLVAKSQTVVAASPAKEKTQAENIPQEETSDKDTSTKNVRFGRLLTRHDLFQPAAIQ